MNFESLPHLNASLNSQVSFNKQVLPISGDANESDMKKYSLGSFMKLICRKHDIAWNCSFRYAAYSRRQITLLGVCKKLCVNPGRIKWLVISPKYTDERLMNLSLKYFTANEEVEIWGSHGGNMITVFWATRPCTLIPTFRKNLSSKAHKLVLSVPGHSNIFWKKCH